MDKVDFTLPFLFADHHVTEVRRILLKVPGVVDVYASSAFQTVEVTFDNAQITAADIQKTLDDAGYLSPLPSPTEDASDHPARSRRLSGDDPVLPGLHFSRPLPSKSINAWLIPGLGLLKK